MAITLDGVAVKLPADLTTDSIFNKAFEDSVVGKLSPTRPVSTNGNVIPVFDGGFEVGYVAEGQPKPVSDVKMTPRQIVPRKFAGIALVSKEAARANPGGLVERLQDDMKNAVQRQIDFGILYGKSARSGAAIPEATYVDQTTSRVELTADDLVPQILAGYDLAAAGNEHADPDGFAFDTRMRSRVARLAQQQLAPAGGTQAMPNLSAPVDTIAGLKAAYGRSVAGRVGTAADTGTVGFVGDWSRLYWGYASNIALTRSTEASIVDSEGTVRHLFQENMIGFLIEFELGWYVDATCYAAFDNKVA